MRKNIYGNVPSRIRRRTYYYMKKYYLNLADAFKEAVRVDYELDPSTYSDLINAFFFDDYRAFIPGEYLSKYLDFEKYPLAYESVDKSYLVYVSRLLGNK